MHPEPYTDDVKHEQLMFDSPHYKLGWTKGLSFINDTNHLTDKIDELEQLSTLSKDCIKRLKNKIEHLENELEMPWYNKLLRKFPRIKISIER